MLNAILILSVSAWIIFLIAVSDGFSHIGSWLVLLVFCAVFGIVIYFEHAGKNKRAGRMETILATAFKWILRGLCGIMILLLIVLSGSVLYDYFVSNRVDGKTTLQVLLGTGLFIPWLVHVFIYGSQDQHDLGLNRTAYRQRKKRYHWKW